MKRLTLVEQVSSHCDADLGFSSAVLDALRLADLYADFAPEAYTLPLSDAFDAYRPLELNRMLIDTIAAHPGPQ
jgi:hypothetical protein